jgi:hypothetical protein
MALFKPDAVAATNNAGIHWPDRLDYWCTLHSAPCPDWIGITAALRQRRELGRNRPQIWGHVSKERYVGVDRTTVDWFGSTGLLAVKVLIEEGFDRIVLAGVPMSSEGGHFYDDKPWSGCDRYRVAWTVHKGEIAPFTRSMSGWTQELLGAPTPEWLAQ